MARRATEHFLMVPLSLAGRRDLHAADKLVLGYLTYRIGDKGKCWPGTRRLAADLGLNRSTILESLDRLATAGEIQIDRRGNGRTNHYMVKGASGWEIQPVDKPNRLENPTGGGGETQPHADGKPNPNKTEPLNQSQGALAAETPGRDAEHGGDGRGITILRSVVWPAPVADAGNTVAGTGNTPPVAGGVAKGVAGAGTHQDSKTTKKAKKRGRGKAAPPADTRVCVFFEFFTAEYQERTGRKYIVQGGKDGRLVKDLLGKVGGTGADPLAELQRATRTMLADPWAANKADIGLLSSQINRWLAPPKAAGGRHAVPAAAAGAYDGVGVDFGKEPIQ